MWLLGVEGLIHRKDNMPDQYEQKLMDILNDYKAGKVALDEAVRRVFGVFSEIMGE